MNDGQPSCVNVAVTLPVRETFDYAVPGRFASGADVGVRVLVPFRNRKVTGYVIGRGGETPVEGIRDVLDVLDPEPLFHEGMVPFFQWLADYYLYPLGPLIQSALPGGLNVTPFRVGRLTEKGLRYLSLLPGGSPEREYLTLIGDNPGKRLPSPLDRAYALEKLGYLTIEKHRSRRRVGPLTRKFVRIKEGADPPMRSGEGARTGGPRGEDEFLEAVTAAGGVPLSDLSGRFPNGAYLVKKWIRRGLLESYTAPVYRNPAGGELFPAPVPSRLYGQQEEVLKPIRARLDRGGFSAFLLHGVTGSGKTEVYHRAVQHAISRNRQAILMVPEIALTAYMEGLFRARLGKRVAIFHSALGEGERYDEWMRMARGEVDLVIGARSALFAPLPRIGLIVVDEEHDFSYKQEESPRYQARDAAVVRGRMEKALVLLGSGTPSVQSFQNTVSGRYRLLSMPERIERRPLPRVDVVDMKEAIKGQRGDGMLSPALREALEDNLEKGRQAILFLNRRGFNRVYLCRFCGQSIRCPNCDLALIYHLGEDRLSCHYCGFHTGAVKTCPSCKRVGVRAYGYGTERLEHELREMYPACRVGRMDRDSARRKGYAFRLLKQFNDREIDVLVGTQMITKGYDFPNVTLVGVIAADFSLGFPDFRASERTFQILSQVAGRAGRGEKTGRVIIQTFNPEHYAITTARTHDYPSFFEREMSLREQLGYPPFSYLACLRFQGNGRDETARAASTVGREMNGILGRWPRRGKEIQVLGPVEAPIAKLKGKYRWQILIKSRRAGLLHYFLQEVSLRARRLLRGTGVTLVEDVDPYQML